MKLLHIDSSIMGELSVTRRITRSIVHRAKNQIPGLEVIHHDLAVNPVAHTSPDMMAVKLGLPVDRTAALEANLANAEQTLAEFVAADIVVIGAPKYNLSISSQLKAWFDKIMIAGKTFKYSEKGPIGLLQDKPIYVVLSSGGFYNGGDHHEPYLRAALSFIGMRSVYIIRAEGVNISPAQKEKTLAAVEQQIAAIIFNKQESANCVHA